MIIHGLSFEEYRRLPGINASSLKILRRSPMAYRHAKDNPGEATASMLLGSVVHTAILEPEKLEDAYAVWTGDSRRGKAWDAFKAEATKPIITLDELETAKAMRDRIRSHEPAMRYLEAGEAEVTLTWTDDQGRAFKARVDWVTAIGGSTVLTDLKTTRDARPRPFGDDCYRLGYHIQFSLYVEGWYANTGEVPRFVVLAQEKTAPFEPAVFNVPTEIIEQGHDDTARLLATLQECEANNHWPPSCEAEQDLTLPTYAYREDEDDLSDLGLSA